jgi:hypothetical protein
LTSFANTKFDVGFGEGDGEQADFVWDLEEALAKAKWSQLPWGACGRGVCSASRRFASARASASEMMGKRPIETRCRSYPSTTVKVFVPPGDTRTPKPVRLSSA